MKLTVFATVIRLLVSAAKFAEHPEGNEIRQILMKMDVKRYQNRRYLDPLMVFIPNTPPSPLNLQFSVENGVVSSTVCYFTICPLTLSLNKTPICRHILISGCLASTPILMVPPPASVVPGGHPTSSNTSLGSLDEPYKIHPIALDSTEEGYPLVETSRVESVFTAILIRFTTFSGLNQITASDGRTIPLVLQVAVTSVGTTFFDTVVTDTPIITIPATSTAKSPPALTSVPEDPVNPSRPSKDSKPIIIAFTIAGTALTFLLAFFIFLFVRRRRRFTHDINMTPFIDPIPPFLSDADAYLGIKKQKSRMIGHKQQLERQPEDHEQASQHSRTDSMTSISDSDRTQTTDEDNINLVLRRQLTIVMQRIAVLEGEINPPQYTSTRGSTIVQ
ncbi:hypothetical protein L218DRAFT_1007442 [Marasmius fiardii PR-910]|nr:hypothetical protein L218DRAFT_1007442 [Marasmius fiardii PR-910]